MKSNVSPTTTRAHRLVVRVILGTEVDGEHPQRVVGVVDGERSRPAPCAAVPMNRYVAPAVPGPKPVDRQVTVWLGGRSRLRPDERHGVGATRDADPVDAPATPVPLGSRRQAGPARPS